MEELRGEEAGMKAEPVKQRRGSSRAEQQGPRQKQKGKGEQIFYLLAAGKEPLYFSYNE